MDGRDFSSFGLGSFIIGSIVDAQKKSEHRIIISTISASLMGILPGLLHCIWCFAESNMISGENLHYRYIFGALILTALVFVPILATHERNEHSRSDDEETQC